MNAGQVRLELSAAQLHLFSMLLMRVQKSLMRSASAASMDSNLRGLPSSPSPHASSSPLAHLAPSRSSAVDAAFGAEEFVGLFLCFAYLLFVTHITSPCLLWPASAVRDVRTPLYTHTCIYAGGSLASRGAGKSVMRATFLGDEDEGFGLGQLELAERLLRRNIKLARLKADSVYRTAMLGERVRARVLTRHKLLLLMAL